MAFDIEPFDATFGAVVRGLKVTALDDAAWRALYDIWLRYALLIFPDQHLTRAEQKAFARRFGPLEIEMMGFSNVKPDGSLATPAQDRELVSVLNGNMRWHTDSSFKEIHAKVRSSVPKPFPLAAPRRDGPTCERPTMRSVRTCATGSRAFAHTIRFFTASRSSDIPSHPNCWRSMV